MISQQYARHNERPVTNRTIEDRRHFRLIQTVRITMAKFLQNFANPPPLFSAIPLHMGWQLQPMCLGTAHNTKIRAMKRPVALFAPGPI